MKKLSTLLLAAALALGATVNAEAIDFNAKGEWLIGMGVVESSFQSSPAKQGVDVFQALQRVRLQLDAVAGEALSGVVYFEIGDQNWGRGSQGGALGADGTIVKLKRAYLDWAVPNTELRFRMGIQGMFAPTASGGSAVFDDDAAAITASYKINDNVGITAFWARPLNDNYTSLEGNKWREDPSNYLDNLDFFVLSLPMSFEGSRVTPWAGYASVGRNVMQPYAFNPSINFSVRNVGHGNTPRDLAVSMGEGDYRNWKRPNSYSDMYFAGLPIKVLAFDPFNLEFDFNYGYSSGFGKYDVMRRSPDGAGYHGRGESKREGWVAKALIEYKMDWGTPGILAWYASGDDGNPKNGSERMPAIDSFSNRTSFLNDGYERGWSLNGGLAYDILLTYDGTWALGLQLKDVSFIEDLRHTFRAVYWGGTNHPGMIKYLATNNAGAFSAARWGNAPYLTTSDYLVEFNLDSTCKVYENLDAVLELGYIVNGYDKDAWRKYYQSNFSKADGYKAALIMQYTF